MYNQVPSCTTLLHLHLVFLERGKWIEAESFGKLQTANTSNGSMQQVSTLSGLWHAASSSSSPPAAFATALSIDIEVTINYVFYVSAASLRLIGNSEHQP